MALGSDEYKPEGDAPSQNDYKMRPGQGEEGMNVVSDETPIDSGVKSGGAEDSDAQLAKDDADAIDTSNIIDSKTRGAGPKGGYREPGDEEGLPGPDDGTSSTNRNA